MKHNEDKANDACNVGALLTSFCHSLQSAFEEEKKGIMAASMKLVWGSRIALPSVHIFAEFGPLEYPRG